MKNFIAILGCTAVLAGCAFGPTPPEELFRVSAEQLQLRQAESRKFDGISEEEIMSASAAALQDMGYLLDSGDSQLGVLTGSKFRDATNAAEIAGAMVLRVLGVGSVPVSTNQTIKASFIINPSMGSDGKSRDKSFLGRISFQRIVYKSNGGAQVETLKDPLLYEEFFDKISKSVFIEAQKL